MLDGKIKNNSVQLKGASQMKKGVIFDLDGVIVSTDGLHYKAWKQMADRGEASIFDQVINNRLRGVRPHGEPCHYPGAGGKKTYTDEEKLEMASMKNELYRESLSTLTPNDILPGVTPVLENCAPWA